MDAGVGIAGQPADYPRAIPKGTWVMKGKESLRISVLGNLAVLRQGTRMRLPQSERRGADRDLAVTARSHSREIR